MTLLWADSMSSYADATACGRRYPLVDATGLQFRVAGRDEEWCLEFGAAGIGIIRTPDVGPTTGTVVIGFAMQASWPETGQSWIVIRNAAAAEQMSVVVNRAATGDYWFTFACGTRTIARSRTYPAGEWLWFELRVKVHPTDGELHWRVNEVTELHLVGVNTTRQGTESWAIVEFRGQGFAPQAGYLRLMDLVILDSGAETSEFPGDTAVELRYPVADSDDPTQFNQWASSGGPHYVQVDDAADGTVDDDALTIPAATVATELYRVRGLRRIRDLVHAIQFAADLRLDVPGPAEGFSFALTTRRQGAAVSLLGKLVVANTYVRHYELMATDPFEGRAWLPEDLETAEFGLVAIT